MLKSKLFWYFFNMFVIFIWGFIIFGFFNTYSGEGLYYTWLTVGIIFIIGHLTEIKKAIPIGKDAGHPITKIVIMTYLFGIGYWYPVKNDIFK